MAKKRWDPRLGFWWNLKCKIWETRRTKKIRYILEFFNADNKIGVQLYDLIEDGIHMVTMNLQKKTKIEDLEKWTVYEFCFNQYKASISKKFQSF